MEQTVKFKKIGFSERLRSMLRVDFRRMFRSRLFYILVATALLIPIVMTVMLTMMDGSVSVNPQTGEETVFRGPESVWESMGTLPSKAQPTTDPAAGGMGGMDVMAMCNVNMMFMLVCVFVCLFVSEDFRSGYVKNLFTVRALKSDYVVSKTLVGFLCGTFMLLAYFIGALLGGGISGLSFVMEGFSVGNLIFCLLAKIFLMLVFVSIFVLISVSAKQKAWLSVCGSLGGGMLLFMTVPMITPLTSTAMNLLLCLGGGVLFALGMGVASNTVLRKTSLV